MTRAARVGEAGLAPGHAKDGKRGEERLAGPDSVSSWISAHYQIGIRKILFFIKSFFIICKLI
jgi:hypothetical protein